ncbi:ScyD/ScyE family protein [Luteimicrobium subarcticum]|uniref:WD40 repeat protein n=1 Tax=Luteimicrobium subarcticum TaxID=620910 RepID=A0A2M8WW47_9MICO|nr:ScyD/ScyE family protein [Luteimicrobium subarcticum]PJI95141.1 WD40 repeat protein [Luteimicrobium subarcticum]
MRTSRKLAALGALGLLLTSAPAVADAHGSHTPTPDPVVRSDQLAAPFNLDLSFGKVWFADGGMNMVGSLGAGGAPVPLATDQPGASGIALSPDGRYLAFTTTVSNEETFENTESGLNIWGPLGSRVYADTHAYEAANNPDQVNDYGVDNPSPCVSDALAALGGPASYTGQVDSHSYSVAAYGRSWVVADAGANTLWKVTSSGDISTLAVLPPQPTTITADQAAALGLPDCVVGVTYAFEPVPTDVEVGRDGMLYVTTLPGGPEGPELGARGAVWKVDPRSGHATRIASGFLGATNLAIGSRGEIYVAELFGGKVSVVQHGKVSTYVDLPGVVAIETRSDGSVWAATLANDDPAAPGTIVQLSKGHASWRGWFHHRR